MLYRKVTNILKHAKYSRYEDSFLWLKDAGVVIPVYNVDEPKPPLRLSETRNLFKLFSNDVGLLAAQYAGGIQLKILTGDSSINKTFCRFVQNSYFCTENQRIRDFKPWRRFSHEKFMTESAGGRRTNLSLSPPLASRLNISTQFFHSKI